MSGLQKMISWEKKYLNIAMQKFLLNIANLGLHTSTQKISKKGMSSKNEIK